MIENKNATFRRQLLNLGRKLQGEVDTLADETIHQSDGKAMGNLSNISVDDRAKLGFDNYCEETTISLLETATARLGEINAALERIDEGTFGNCEDCGQEISISRLQTIPFTRECIECARKSQKGEAVLPGNL
jgi:DnaK suppressor protein